MYLRLKLPCNLQFLMILYAVAFITVFLYWFYSCKRLMGAHFQKHS